MVYVLFGLYLLAAAALCVLARMSMRDSMDEWWSRKKTKD